MTLRMPIALSIAIMLLTACSSAPKPKTLNGRHRQPVNMGILFETKDTETLPDHSASALDRAPCISAGTSAVPETASVEEPARMFRFQFPHGGIALAPPGETGSEWAELVNLAKHAQRIQIRGRTDGMTHSRGDEHIALQRAITARNALVKHGVNPAHIQMDYLSGGDYLADNTTQEGRQQNRRVEIELKGLDQGALTGSQ